jgi:hypothetical protein
LLGRLLQRFARTHIEAAAVQRTAHKVAAKNARGERSVFVRAAVGDGAKAPVYVGEQELLADDVDAFHRSRLKLAHRRHIYKILRHIPSPLARHNCRHCGMSRPLHGGDIERTAMIMCGTYR